MMGAAYLLALAAVTTLTVYGLREVGRWGERYCHRAAVEAERRYPERIRVRVIPAVYDQENQPPGRNRASENEA